MALATESSGRLSSVEPSPMAWSTGDGDRSRAFEEARRHSRIVSWLKVILPVCALAVLSSYGFSVQRSIPVGNGKIELGPVSFSTEVLTMHNPRYEGYGKDGSRFLVTAKTAEQDIGQDGPIRLNAIEGSIVQPNKVETTLTATRGLFDTDSNELELLDSIEIKSSEGMVARLTRAKAFLKDAKIVSEEPVSVAMPTGTLNGRSMVLLQRSREATFSGGVEARFKPNARADEAQQSTARLIGNSDAPIVITAPVLTIYDARKTAVFSGDVRVEQADAVMTTRTLEVAYDGDNGSNTSQLPTAGGSRINRIFARDNVVLTRGDDRVTSAVAEFNPSAETAVLAGGVAFSSGANRQALADRADLDLKAETALLTGNVVVSQDENMLTGRRLFVDQKNATMQLSSPATEGAGAGRITAKFRSNTSSGRRQTATAANSNAWQFQTDPNAPVAIEADVLDVDDKAKSATFRGDVVVPQGDFIIRTPELVATYAGQATANLMQPSAPEARSQSTQLQRVQARRRVVITSKDDQTATGDWADFDVKTNTVVLGGNVTLTQGRNVVRGPRLVIDMTTGLSRMETGRNGAQTAGSGTDAPGKKGVATGDCGGRMCAVFYPEDIKALAQRKARNAPAAGNTKKESAAPDRRVQGEAASSWSSTTIRSTEE